MRSAGVQPCAAPGHSAFHYSLPASKREPAIATWARDEAVRNARNHIRPRQGMAGAGQILRGFGGRQASVGKRARKRPSDQGYRGIRKPGQVNAAVTNQIDAVFGPQPFHPVGSEPEKREHAAMTD
jgi:hypothetical protein